ncbi:hypothetical protein Tco_0242970 [Tanacetum coccineum]
MLAASGGGLILYQAYGNLYAMIGRKSHLLKDKQIPSVGVFDEHLEEIRPTWAHLEKKRTRQRLYTNSLEEYANSGWQRCLDFQATVSRVICVGVKSYKRRCQDFAKVSGFWQHRRDEPT